MNAPRFVLALCLLAAGAFACGGGSSGAAPADDDDVSPADDDASPAGEARIALPPYPFWPNDGLLVDIRQMEDSGTTYCAAHAAAASATDFFLGDLPMNDFNRFDSQAQAATASRELMGDLYISGFFGGQWLKQVLGAGADGLDFAQLQAVFTALADLAAGQISASAAGTDAAILQNARNSVFPLLALYAYNLGYLQQIIAHPPSDASPPDDLLICDADVLLDCRSPEVNWPFIEQRRAALDKLRTPPNEPWQEMATLMQEADSFVEPGRLVWQFISLSNLDAAGYTLLLDLSLNFLLASEAAALGEMTAWADDRPADGRLTMLLDGGMVVWGGSYFMGLAAADAGAFPQLICP